MLHRTKLFIIMSWITTIVSFISSIVVFNVNGWTMDALAKHEISQFDALRLVWATGFLSWLCGLIIGMNICQNTSAEEQVALSSDQYNRRSYGATAI